MTVLLLKLVVMPLFISLHLQPTVNVQAQTDRQAAIVSHIEQPTTVLQASPDSWDALQPALGWGALNEVQAN